MQPDKKDIAFLWDMLQAARDIHEFTTTMSMEQFATDKRTRFAVERQLLVIGEAANRVSVSLQKIYPEIPWRRIIGQRNVLAHEYGEILVERIWLVVKDEIPKLIEALDKLLPEE
jgi:uncharacterized protein with HEPN domain